MWIVKLGGSLAESPHLRPWLESLSQTGAIIVPGGGPFADAVRRAQARWHFGQATAHPMAVLGMRQYGLMLAGLCPGLLMATTPAELAASPGRAKVWLPLPALLDRAGIPATWDVTSDSLAAWLAGQTRAADLLLVKSFGTAPPAEAMPPLAMAQLVNQGRVDPVFPEYAARSACQSWLCGPDGHRALPQGLADPARHFIRIAP